ncbi:MAG: Gx transporter family protein [Oscillospiraceae bacterium]|jgi:heptaprenyl diphosphate synthase|nr:Gx transporter family protein [Oscillospiraceae bacterium]
MGGERVLVSTKRTALTGLLAALALALSFFESLLSPVAFLPPGVKLGLANVVVMLALYLLGLPYAFGIVLARSGFAFFLRGASAFFISLAGGLLSLSVLFLFKRFLAGRVGVLGVSVSSAVMHNVGQLAAACIIASTNLFFGYGPPLLLFGIGAGAVTGLVYWAVAPFAARVFGRTE